MQDPAPLSLLAQLGVVRPPGGTVALVALDPQHRVPCSSLVLAGSVIPSKVKTVLGDVVSMVVGGFYCRFRYGGCPAVEWRRSPHPLRLGSARTLTKSARTAGTAMRKVSGRHDRGKCGRVRSERSRRPSRWRRITISASPARGCRIFIVPNLYPVLFHAPHGRRSKPIGARCG